MWQDVSELGYSCQVEHLVCWGLQGRECSLYFDSRKMWKHVDSSPHDQKPRRVLGMTLEIMSPSLCREIVSEQKDWKKHWLIEDQARPILKRGG